MRKMSEIIKSGKEHMQSTDSGIWIPADYIEFPTLIQRFKDAWLVFTGKAKAVVWE